MAKIQLYTYATSPYGMKVACLLKYKGLDFEWVPVNPITNRQIAFTKQRQVPVLKIGDEWRKDSTPLGIWLEELYPERPILGAGESQRAKILEVDRWVSDSMFPATFRQATDWSDPMLAARTGWRLAEILNEDTYVPYTARFFWPVIIKYVPFITRMTDPLKKEPLAEMNHRLCREFRQHLGTGPFLGGLNQPSLADLSAFTTIFAKRLLGFSAPNPFFEDATIKAWGVRVKAELPYNPFLAADKFITGSVA